MHGIRRIFTLDLVAPQFLFGLRAAKQVCGQLGGSHVIEDVLAFLKLFALVNGFGGQTVIQSAIAVILEHREVLSGDHARCFRH